MSPNVLTSGVPVRLLASALASRSAEIPRRGLTIMNLGNGRKSPTIPATSPPAPSTTLRKNASFSFTTELLLTGKINCALSLTSGEAETATGVSGICAIPTSRSASKRRELSSCEILLEPTQTRASNDPDIGRQSCHNVFFRTGKTGIGPGW